MGKIFKENALIAVGYSIIFVLISFLFQSATRDIILNFGFGIVAGIHLITTGILMVINYLKHNDGERNAYFATFNFIWVLMVLVHLADFYSR